MDYLGVSGLVARKRILARARIDIDSLDMAIGTYKLKKGTYPPDNPRQPAGAFTNQLFYELWGAVVQSPLNPTDPVFTNTFNANETVDALTLSTFFGNGTTPVGIVNSSADTNDVINFIRTLTADRIQNINVANPSKPVWVFVDISPGPTNNLPVSASTKQFANVIRYVSSNPTNNPNTFDLWVDVIIAGKTNRVSNWSKDPEIVNN